MAQILPKSHGFIQAMRVLQAVVAPALIGSAACGRGPLFSSSYRESNAMASYLKAITDRARVSAGGRVSADR
jgi:hypothetical protein